MKKIILALVLVSALLCGCQAEKSADITKYYNAVSKVQEIAVVSADGTDTLQIIAEKADIVDFVAALDMEKWKLGKLPEEAQQIGSLVLSQEETVKLGQTKTEGELHCVCGISVYAGSYINLEIAGWNMAFEVSEDTAEYLMNLFLGSAD